MSDRPVRIAVVNDYSLVVAGTARVLEAYAHRVEVVELDANKPVISDVDVVLYDTFAQTQGSAVDPASLTGEGGARFAVFTWNTDTEQVRSCLERGAAGVISKGSSAEDLVDALERLHRGERVVPPAHDAQSPDNDTFGRWPGDEHGLSPRESEVLALICQGLSNVEIAERAYLGINTVKTYIRSLYRKIEVTTRSQAVIWGLSHGFAPDTGRVMSPQAGAGSSRSVPSV